MPVATIKQGTAFEDGGVSLMARVVGNDAANITQSSISTITYKVFKLSDLTTDLAANSPLTVSSVVFDTLQTDARWTEDSTGYNFRHDLVAAELPTGNQTIRVEFKFTPTSGAPFHVVFEVDLIDLHGS